MVFIEKEAMWAPELVWAFWRRYKSPVPDNLANTRLKPQILQTAV